MLDDDLGSLLDDDDDLFIPGWLVEDGTFDVLGECEEPAPPPKADSVDSVMMPTVMKPNKKRKGSNKKPPKRLCHTVFSHEGGAFGCTLPAGHEGCHEVILSTTRKRQCPDRLLDLSAMGGKVDATERAVKASDPPAADHRRSPSRRKRRSNDNDAPPAVFAEGELGCFCDSDRHLPDTPLPFCGIWLQCDVCNRWCHAECTGIDLRRVGQQRCQVAPKLCP